ncbi:unnamed protein product, partial [Medioppia subpectinata]
TDLKLFGQTSDESTDEVLIKREDNTRHETQDNREKTSAEEVVDSEDNESNDGIDCHINNDLNDETDVGSDAEDKYQKTQDLINNSIEFNDELNRESIDSQIIDDLNTKLDNKSTTVSDAEVMPKTIESVYKDKDVLKLPQMSHLKECPQTHSPNELIEEINNGSVDSQRMCELNTKSNRKRKQKSAKNEDNNSETEEYGSGLMKGWLGNGQKDRTGRLRRHAFSHLNEKEKKSMVYKKISRGRYACLMDACNETFKEIRYLRGHQMLHLNEPFKCPQTDCPFVTINKLTLYLHVKTHPKPYACDECGARFKITNRLTEHKQKKHTTATYRCDWPACGRSYAFQYLLKHHMNTHTAAVNHPCEWPGCGHTYTNINSLRIHVHRVHKGMADYRCHWPECDYKTTNRIRLNNHIHRQHEGLDDYQCSHTGCDYKTKKCGEMDNHMKIHTKS